MQLKLFNDGKYWLNSRCNGPDWCKKNWDQLMKLQPNDVLVGAGWTGHYEVNSVEGYAIRIHLSFACSGKRTNFSSAYLQEGRSLLCSPKKLLVVRGAKEINAFVINLRPKMGEFSRTLNAILDEFQLEKVRTIGELG